MAGHNDYHQTCGTCGKRFLSYPGGKPECLTCWAIRCPAVALSFGVDIAPGGIIESLSADDVEPLTDEPPDLFPGVDALLKEVKAE